MPWRVEWIGASAAAIQPTGWALAGERAEVVAVAGRVLRADPRADLRIVQVERVGGVEIDLTASHPDLATLALWDPSVPLPATSPCAAVPAAASAAVRRQLAADRLRDVLDRLVDDGDVTRYEAGALLACFELSMIRSAAATAA